MLQRSPTYIFSLPGYSKLIGALENLLPRRLLYSMLRSIHIRLQQMLYKSAKRWPHAVQRFLLRPIERFMGKDFDMRHFTPAYKPWDQRLCMVPDGDLLRAIQSGKASVVTDEIEKFTANGIALKSGAHLEADIIVTATGLQLKTFGGVQLRVDGKPLVPAQLLSYRAVLMQDLPNLGFIFGYTNASWTLKSDMASQYLCRLLNHMDRHGCSSVTPRAPATEKANGNVMGSLSSGYVQRGLDELPRQGCGGPWKVTHAFALDQAMLLQQPIDDGLLEFTYNKTTVLSG
jgi:monooxygenase